MSDNPTLDAISADLADIKRQLEAKAQSEVTGAIQGVHTKLDSLAQAIVAEIVKHLGGPMRAGLYGLGAGIVIGGLGCLAALHAMHLIG